MSLLFERVFQLKHFWFVDFLLLVKVDESKPTLLNKYKETKEILTVLLEVGM